MLSDPGSLPGNRAGYSNIGHYTSNSNLEFS
jgi:hypothetical protein